MIAAILGAAYMFDSIRRCMAVFVWCATSELAAATHKHWLPIRAALFHKLHELLRGHDHSVTNVTRDVCITHQRG